MNSTLIVPGGTERLNVPVASASEKNCLLFTGGEVDAAPIPRQAGVIRRWVCQPIVALMVRKVCQAWFAKHSASCRAIPWH